MPPDLKPKRRSGNISKSFITASGAIRALAIWHRPCLRKNSANNRLVVEVGVSTIVRTGQCVPDDQVKVSCTNRSSRYPAIRIRQRLRMVSRGLRLRYVEFQHLEFPAKEWACLFKESLVG